MVNGKDYHQQLINKIQLNLSEDLLNKKWKNKKRSHITEGHCYIATEILYYLIDKENWKPMVASYIENGEKLTHWWLENKNTKKILDPTKEQYGEFLPPYNLGRGCGFLTNKPSKRALKIINKIKNENIN